MKLSKLLLILVLALAPHLMAMEEAPDPGKKKEEAGSQESSENQGSWLGRLLRSQYRGAVNLLAFGRGVSNQIAQSAKNSVLYHPINFKLCVAISNNNAELLTSTLEHPASDINYTYGTLPLWAQIYRRPDTDACRQALLNYEQRIYAEFTEHDRFCRAIVIGDFERFKEFCEEITIEQNEERVKVLRPRAGCQINGPLKPVLLAASGSNRDIFKTILDCPDLDISSCKAELLHLTHDADLLALLMNYNEQLHLDMNNSIRTFSTSNIQAAAAALAPFRALASDSALVDALKNNKFAKAAILANSPHVDATQPSSDRLMTAVDIEQLHQFYAEQAEVVAAYLRRLEDSKVNSRIVITESERESYRKAIIGLELIRNIAHKGGLINCVDSESMPALIATVANPTGLRNFLLAFDGIPQVYNPQSLERHFWKMPALNCEPLQAADQTESLELSLDYRAYYLYAFFILYNWALWGDCFFEGLFEDYSQAGHAALDLNNRMLAIVNQLNLQIHNGNIRAFERKYQEDPSEINRQALAIAKGDFRAIAKTTLKTFVKEIFRSAESEHKEFSVNDRDLIGCTPFMWAGARGRVDLAKFLIEMPHLNPNACDSRGFTALHLAALNGCADVVRFLLGRDEINIEQKTATINTSNELPFGACTGVTACTLAKRRAFAVAQLVENKEMAQRYAEVLHYFSELHKLRRQLYMALLKSRYGQNTNTGKPVHQMPRDVCKLIALRLHLSEVNEAGEPIAVVGDANGHIMKKVKNEL